MKILKLFITSIVTITLFSCSSSKTTSKVNVLTRSTENETSDRSPSTSTKTNTSINSNSGGNNRPMLSMNEPLDISPTEFLNYAKQYLGVPYLYASSDPTKGLDCSGLLYHVFKHFNVKSPRSSYDYENIGKEISLEKAKKGDLILFTTEGNPKKIGHIGIIAEGGSYPSFLHASTSKGVIVSDVTGYYIKHFVKVIRILK